MGRNLRERIVLSKEELLMHEKDFIDKRHIERYALARQFVYGNVLDFGCGCGYGSYLLSVNPDVSTVYAYDINDEIIDYARDEFDSDNIVFSSDILVSADIDVMVCLEIAEHIKDKRVLPVWADKLNAKRLIVSYPSKKTTHYNKYHYHDFIESDILDMFNKYRVIKNLDLWHECKVFVMERNRSWM